MSTLRDHLWLWGQEPGSHHTRAHYRLPGNNKMTPVQGGEFFGISNCCRVVMEDRPAYSFDEEAPELLPFKQVVWSAIGAGGVSRFSDDRSDLPEVLRQAERFQNITGAVLDDFFNSVEGFQLNGRIARHSVASIQAMREKLHSFPGRKLDLWLVWYSYQLDFEVQAYVDLSDVVTLWTWKGADLVALDANIEKFASRTPTQRRLAGCYMWNYGEGKPLTATQMAYQLDRYLYWIKQGVLEGLVLCSNCIADIGLETVEQMRTWIDENGAIPVEPAGLMSRGNCSGGANKPKVLNLK